MKELGTFNRRFFFYLLSSLLLLSCRSLSTANSSDLLTVQTSAALEESCRREISTADVEELKDAESSLGRCTGSMPAVQAWSKKTQERIKSNWPKDFIASGPGGISCLNRLTQGALVRYLSDLLQACEHGDSARKLEISAVAADSQTDVCYDIVSMTADGCFVVRGCNGGLLDSKTFSNTSVMSRKELILCSERIQKIHRIKDPDQSSLLYNYSYVSELTGNQSSNRITYGPPNCHGTAQAAAGGVFDDLRLESTQHARLANQGKCDEAVNKFFDDYKSTAISQIPMQPGGIMVNMKYESCKADDCGRVNLWVEDCKAEKLELAVFIDGMCVDCWENKLAVKGFKRQATSYSGKQFVPGCILTANDHSVMVLGQSRGMCFFYEATSPYGPPQIRSVPCPVLNHKFSRQYCPEQPSINWRVK